jgi:hypothetical protein
MSGGYFSIEDNLVQIFVEQVQKGERTRENVPPLLNLQEIVWSELDKLEAREEG